MRVTFFLFVSFSMVLTALSQPYKPEWNSLDSRNIPAWFSNAKFGIFIHWGVYSVPAYRPIEKGLYASYAEWYYAKVYANEKNGGKEFHEKNYGKDFEYRQFAPLFRAELWDPQQWARLFKSSGAKYVVLTSKHHDGYCLWPTKSPYKKNWNAMAVGPKRDIVGELTEAVRKEGMKMGLYYSIIEWESSKTHRSETGYYVPLNLVEKYQIPREDYVDKHLIPQLKELVVNYTPSLIFSDGGEWDESEEYLKTKEFLAWLYNESPVKNEVVVNDRFAKGMPGKHGDYFSSEYKDASIDFNHPWEESRGIGASYGLNRAENIEHYSTSKQLITELVDIVSRGGNLLLNVGPAADGTLPVIMQERLLEIGNWLKVNGESIYDTRKTDLFGSTNNPVPVYFTGKGSSVYAIFTEWPEQELKFSLKPGVKVKSLSFVGTASPVTWKVQGNELLIKLPSLTINHLPCRDAWALRIEVSIE
ncbi:alpha-L-fucosidase [Flavihumibacter rivuli]|uniref:alpha-L-fucosidase n=1 Tax=Flavihumibacter rivuli TaxID=2838156 RepID=UPI001BDF3CB9|nr:alpha-L-fucosidase [Flavihumibacter rivuli]ULQ55346.1 alpha-L-fucosidase [Flavihumibacter rivuli]